jgi:hypothetical protein
MPTVTEKVSQLDQQGKNYDYDQKAEEMKKRWEQLKHRKRDEDLADK